MPYIACDLRQSVSQQVCTTTAHNFSIELLQVLRIILFKFAVSTLILLFLSPHITFHEEIFV